jgi:hypothetical protein
LVGTPWPVTDYARDDDVFDKTLLYEKWKLEPKLVGQNPHHILTTFATKIGGHPVWYKGDKTPKCGCGKKMRFLGQFISENDIEIADRFLQIFHCADKKCGQTKLSVGFH